MRATVDRGRCQGHAQCVLNVPDLFALDDKDSHAYVLLDPVPDNLAKLARSAVTSCPERAISLTDSPAGVITPAQAAGREHTKDCA